MGGLPNILLMGFTFKENCPDIRNTRVIDVVKELKSYNANVDVWDPWAEADEVKHEYGMELITQPQPNHYDAIIITVGHNEFKAMTRADLAKLGKDNHLVFDVKHLLPKDEVDARL